MKSFIMAVLFIFISLKISCMWFDEIWYLCVIGVMKNYPIIMKNYDLCIHG